MARLIDADALQEEYVRLSGRELSLIEDAPTVDPVKHGKWIKVDDDYNNHLYECSYCHTWTSLPNEEVDDGNIRYCWSCGARMNGVKE